MKWYYNNNTDFTRSQSPYGFSEYTLQTLSELFYANETASIFPYKDQETCHTGPSNFIVY